MDKVADNASVYASMTPDKAIKEIAKLEKKMFQHAKDLEFEQAAQVRDEISKLREMVFK
jgi:excinuclease ABC subunit B